MKNKVDTTSKKPTWKFDLGLALVYGAAAFQAYHMGRAFHVYDPDGWHFANVNFGGLILGAILNVIVARTATQLPNISATFASLKELLPKATKKTDKQGEKSRARALKTMTLAMKKNAYSQFGFYVLLSFSALMVAPALYILWTKTLPFHPVFIGLMAVVGAVAPDVAITVGGVVAGSSVVGAGSKASVKRPRTASDSATQSVGSASESATSATDSVGQSPKYPRRCEHCASDSPFAVLNSANAVGGHMKKHHPELCKTKARATLAENLFSKVDA
ncbi:MAG: hypothetical protein HY865_09490 [Chloroflexi bacterium]|nr:hypothetical protein [Chloroflexota bacterium]